MSNHEHYGFCGQCGIELPVDESAELGKLRDKLKIATVANEQFKADLHQRDDQIAQIRKELKAANKGAQTNALVNQSLSKQLWELREKLAAVREIFLEWTESDFIGEWCHGCETEGLIGKFQHSQSCRVGKALAIIDGKATE